MARTVLASLFAIGLSAVAVPTPASAACDETYEPRCVTVSVGDDIKVGGNRIQINATAQASDGSAVNCQFSVTFSGEAARHINGSGATGSGSTFSRSFTTEEVDEDVSGTAEVLCRYDDGTVPTALGGTTRLATALVAAPALASGSGGVTLLAEDDGDDDDDGDDSDDSDDDDGGLPDTGGERLLWLLIGLALVAGGATVIVSSRNRDSSA